MKKWIFTGLILSVATICFFGCQPQRQTSKATAQKANIKGAVLLSVDFEPNIPLKYNFVSERKMTVDLDPTGKYSKGKQSGKEQEQSEKLEMQISYKAIKIGTYGFSTIQATCESAKVTRTMTGRAAQRADAVESLPGKSFTLLITPAGKVVDYNSLEELSKELGQKSFGGAETGKGKVKSPDMIMDFLATQWNIWDSTASIKNPAKGVKKGNIWDSKLIAPMPFVSKIGRNVEYKFAGIEKSDNASLAEITSTYSLSETPANVPLPYSGSFQMKGMFGFLQGYKVLSIEGSGKQLFDINKGLIKSDTQHYEVKVSASIFGLGSDTLEPNIKIDQTITMTLAE